jgi:hypothetical protein
MMVFLDITIGEITGIVGAAATALTVFIIPLRKYIKKKQSEKQNAKTVEVGQTESIKILAEKVGAINVKQEGLIKKIDSFLTDYEEFTTQNLKYMINDAFFGYSNIHEIPDDILTNACECCEIYVNKRHHNHEIKPRCKLMWDEQERRAIDRRVHHGE